mgnify:FL=1
MEERSLELKKAGLAIPKVLEQNRLLLPYHLYQAKRDWKQIAGEQIAKYSYILDFKDKQVIIAVMNPVYMNYLFMYKNKIIEEINSYVGHRAIADVRFVKKGKKPVRTVYETLEGEVEDVFPKETISRCAWMTQRWPISAGKRLICQKAAGKSRSAPLCSGQTEEGL